MSRKDTIESMQLIAKGKGGKCLSIEYVDQRTPLQWRCAEGHIWSAKPSDVKGNKAKPGTWCKVCGIRGAAQKRMHSVERMQQLAAGHCGAFASAEYLGSYKKHQWRCHAFPNHPEFAMIPNAVQQGQWCPKCRGTAKPTLDELNGLARDRHPLAKWACPGFVER